MSTVNFLCGYCNELIAVSADHLGQHVECPRCQQVVQAPLDAAAPEDVTQSDADMSQEKYDAPPAAAESHTEALADPEPPPPPNLDSTLAFDAPTSPPPLDHFSAGGVASASTMMLDDGPARESALPPPTISRPRDRGVFGIILLMFLIPYALVTTGFIAYLLYQLNLERNKPAPFDPLERLPDPNPDKGGPKRVKFDTSLPDKLKIKLGQQLEVGDLTVKAVGVRHAEASLVLVLKVKNRSRDTAFNPLPDAFLRYGVKGASENKPYTFLEVGDAQAFGGFVDYRDAPQRAGRFDGVLQPGEAMTVVLETTPNFANVVARALKADEPLVWRVQLRRGFVDVKGKDVSATAILGVEFGRADIREGAEATLRRSRFALVTRRET